MKYFFKMIALPSAIFFVITGCVSNAAVSRAQLLMGTTMEISVAGPVARAAKLEAIDKAFNEIRRVENLMSSFKPASDVSKINNFADIRPIEVSSDTIKVIKRADEISKITGGAFDITVAPLVDLWGFGPGNKILRAPDDEQLARAVALVGMNNVKIDYSRKTVRFARQGMKIDLSGIAVGYAVDLAIGSLRQSGIKDAMVNAGGEVFCMGRSGTGRKWKVGIQHPRAKNGLLAAVSLDNRAIATSGDYEKFFIMDGKRISHIIDPATGKTISGIPASVSITAPDCMTADALSTAIFVLGPEKGIDILKRLSSVEGMIAVEDASQIKVYKTDGFAKN